MLESAAVYMGAGDRMTIAAYRGIWRKKLRGSKEAKTLGLPLDRVREELPVAYELLCLFAWLAADRIPRKELLEAGETKLPAAFFG